ncbi:MAG: CHAT domain-containing protein [Deltaproteobacteria bacterium]|nr:CHAT domain-containing protein [Deltaproteobacteria bacterium]
MKHIRLPQSTHRSNLIPYLFTFCLLLVFLILLALPAGAQNSRVSVRDIQNAQRQASQAHRAADYTQEVKLRQQIYDWSRQLFGARHVQTAAAAFELGKAQMTLGNFGPVEPLFLEALAIFEAQRIRNDPNVATILNSLATYYTRMGQMAEAMEAYDACVQILSARRSVLGLSTVHYNQATLYRLQGLALREYAQRVPEAGERRKIEAEAQGWFVAAQKLLQQDLDLLSRLRLPAKDTRRHNRESTLGEVELDLGDFPAADRLFVSANEFWARNYGRDTHGRDLLNLGLSRLALGQYAQALDLFQRGSAWAAKSLGQDNPTYPTTLALQARALAHLGRFAEAAALMDRCQRQERHYELRVFPALSQTEQLSYLFRPGYLEGRNLDLALALGAAGRRDPALAERSAEWLLNGKAMVHELLAERALAARNHPGQAATELLKAQSMEANLLTQLDSAPEGSAAAKQAVRELSQWVRREASLAKQFGRGQGAGQSPAWISLAAVRQKIPADALLVELARFQAPTVGAKGREAISGSPRYAAWLIPPAGQGQVTVIDLGEAAPLEQAIKEFRATMDRDVRKIRADIINQANQELTAYAQSHQLKSSDEAYKKRRYQISQAAFRKIKDTFQAQAPRLLQAYRQHAAPCAKLLLAPLAGRLTQAKEILLSPDAHTWLPPWGALPWPGSDELLLQRATLTYLVSGRDLLTLRRQEAPAAAPLEIGDVDYNAGVRSRAELVKYPAAHLAWSLVEIKGIEPPLGVYANMKPVVLRGSQATEGRLKAAKNPKVLFMSTHGVFSNVNENTFRPGQRGLLLENPLLRSELLLAGANRRYAAGDQGEDGRLYGIEVESLDLRATDLVVLSACQTALGDVHAGQGAAGLRQAFQLAGAKSVVATLWSVDDEATTLLTIAFFKNLAAGKPKAEALRQAELELFRQGAWAHPYFWAAFTITENGEL